MTRRAPYVEGPDRYRFGGERFVRVGRLKKDFFSCNELLRDEAGRLWVLKVSRFLYLGRLVQGAARYLSRREQRFYRRLQGVPGIPELHPATGPNWLLHAYIPGKTLHARRDVDPAFFDRLLELVARTHARGVASVDLSKKANIIVGDDGDPYLIDFQIAMAVREPTQAPFQQLANVFTRALMREDLYHVYKHKRRLMPDRLREGELERGARKSAFSSWYRRLLGWPAQRLKRLIFPHGSHELYLFRRPKPGDDVEHYDGG